MTPDQEKQLLQALYDRLFQFVTYRPEGAFNPFDKKETFIHFAQNEALAPEKFKDAWDPTNPNGDRGASELFSQMVDKVSTVSLEWNPKDQPLSLTYKTIVDGMNEAAAARPSPQAVAAYNKAHDYLFKSEKNPFTGEISSGAKTQEYQEYQKKLDALSDTYQNYVKRYNGFVDDLTNAADDNAKKKAQREWNADEPPLRRAIDHAQDELTVGNAKWVKMALDTMNTSINDATAIAMADAKSQVESGKFSAGLAGTPRWLLTYANPPNWHSEAAAKNFTDLKISGKNKVDDKESTRHAYKFGAKYEAGLWGVGVGSGGDFKGDHHHFEADSIDISCKIAKINIVRPWFSELLFRSDNWYTNLKDKKATSYISNGKLESTNSGSILPMYPVAFIVARDITITSSFKKKDEEKIDQAASGKASVSFGPFEIGGEYAYGRKGEHFNSTRQGGTITVPGMQIIAWVSRLMPASPVKSQEDLDK